MRTFSLPSKYHGDLFFSRRLFPFKENCPTTAVTFFLHTTILTLVHFLETILKPPKAKSGQCKLSPKGPPFHFLPFQGNIQNRTCLKGSPFGLFSALCDFSSFLIFCNRIYVTKSKRVPLKHFSALCDIFRNYAEFHVFFSKKCLALFKP